WLYRLDLARRRPAALEAMHHLAGRIDETRMIRANARVVLGKQPFQKAADSLLVEALGGSATRAKPPGVADAIAKNTLQHLKLVALSLLAAILIGVPLGVVAARFPMLAGPTLTAV